ncbi:MAG TPA: hypothetical protein VHY08_18545 [Bacillota bacterium]|nr:hypothetical protein [Bacillota bacterium]
MDLEKEKLIKAAYIINKMAAGVNPVNGSPIEKDHFLREPKIIGCLAFVEEVLHQVIEGQVRIGKAPEEFRITDEQKSKIELPGGKIGVNEFAKYVNQVIDLNQSKKLTGLELNKQLKKMGILAEKSLEDGKTRTIATGKSTEYGIEMEMRSFNGREYEMVVFNEKAQKFLLDNLEKIMTYQKESASENENPA